MVPLKFNMFFLDTFQNYLIFIYIYILGKIGSLIEMNKNQSSTNNLKKQRKYFKPELKNNLFFNKFIEVKELFLYILIPNLFEIVVFCLFLRKRKIKLKACNQLKGTICMYIAFGRKIDL